MPSFTPSFSSTPYDYDNVDITNADATQYVGDEELLGVVDRLRVSITENQLTDEVKQEIYETVTHILSGQQRQIDPLLQRYLFLGWYLSTHVGEDTIQEPDSGD